MNVCLTVLSKISSGTAHLLVCYLLLGFSPRKSDVPEICHIDNQYDVIFSAKGGPIWITFRRLVQNDVDCSDVVKIESKCDERLGEFNGMSSQCHLRHCRVLPPGEFNVMISELRVILQMTVL